MVCVNMASLMTLVCFLRDISNYCLCEWLSLLLQASPDVLCDIQVVKWVPHNNHFSINFYMLNWLYDLQVAIMIYFLALTDQSIAFISQISTKNNCFLLLQFIPSRLADSYSSAIRYIRLLSDFSHSSRSLRSTYLGCGFNFCLLHLTTIFGGSFAKICCILVPGLKPAPWMFSQCCASCQIVFILICWYLQELIDQWLWN